MIKRRGFFIKIIFALIVVAGILHLARNLLAVKIIRYRLSKETGFSVKIDELSFSALTSKLSIKRMEILNPADYETQRALLMEDLQCSISVKALLSNRVEVSDVHLRITELNAVKSKDGILNIESLNQWFKANLDSKRIQIQKLFISMNQVNYINETAPDQTPLVFQCKTAEIFVEKIQTSEDFDLFVNGIVRENALSNIGSLFKGVLNKFFKD